MAAANASPTYRGRTTGQTLQIGQRQFTPSSHNGTGLTQTPMTTSQSGHITNGTIKPPGHAQKLYDYENLPKDFDRESRELEEISDEQLYLPDSGYKMDRRGLAGNPRDSSSSNVLVAKGLPSYGTRQDLEVEHLRTQVKSISVLQDLLSDARSEIQGLQEVVEDQGAMLRQHGLEVRPVIQEKLSRLRLGSSIVPESEWSVELKRPPATSHIDGNDQVSELSRRLQATEEETRGLREETARLHSLLRASADEKEREIGRLREQAETRARSCLESDAACRSLSGETEMLRTRIQLLVEECQGLATELSGWKKKKIAAKIPPITMSDTPVSLEDQLLVARRQVQQLEREKGQLAGQLKEVVTMNKRWQKYNRQQDQVRQELTQTKIDLENQMKVCELQCKEYDATLADLRRQLQEAEAERRHRRVDTALLAGKEESVRRLEQRVAELEQELRRSHRDARSRDSRSRQDQEEGSKFDTEMVRQQLKQYTDDFQKEHTEKEKLKRDNALLHRNQLEAEELLQEINRKLDVTERENRDLKKELRRSAVYGYDDMLPRERRELIAHGMQQNGGGVVSLGSFPTLPKDVQPDGFTHTPPSHSPISPPISPPPPIMSNGRTEGEDCVDGHSRSRSPREDEPLQCPRCLREFPVSKHSDFMRHTEYCLDT